MCGISSINRVAIHHNLTSKVTNSRTDIVGIRYTPADTIHMGNHSSRTVDAMNSMAYLTTSV